MRQFSYASLLFVFVLLSLPQAASADAPPSRFEGRDLFALQVATDPQVRSDGDVVAYTRITYDIMTDRGRSSIWLVDTDSAEQVPIVSGDGDHSSPRWSPDGTRLAYVSTVQANKPQLFVRWMQSGVAARVAELIEAPSHLSWSPDGKWIAFMMLDPDEKPKLGEAPPKPEGAEWAPPLEVITDLTYRADGAGYLKPGYTHVYVVPADGGAPRQLTFGAFNEDGPLTWTPDSRFLIANGNRLKGWERDPVNSEIYRISVADGEIKALTTRPGPDTALELSPDGTQLAYVGFDDELMSHTVSELYVMDLETGASRSLTRPLDRSIVAAQWAANGRSLYVQYDDEGITRIARVALNGRIDPVAEGLSGASLDRPYTGGQFTVSDNDVVAFTSGTVHRPSDISIVKRGKRRQLTHLSEALLSHKALGEVTQIEVTSSVDGRAIDAWIVTPPEMDPNKQYPLILEIHGGPFAAYGPVFSTDNQLYAAAGYVVLYANPRGSTSYGEEFANLIHHKYPGHDYDDLMSAVDAAIAEGYVDPDDLFVTGGSGGGVLTAWIVGKTDRFRAAATQKPVINWTSTVLTTDVYTFMPKYWFEAPPWVDHEAYWQRSPLSLVGSVKTPTLVVVGDRDFRTPLSDSEQYYQALQLHGVPTGLVKVPEASHGGLTARPSQSAAKASAILAWFEKYRKSPP